MLLRIVPPVFAGIQMRLVRVGRLVEQINELPGAGIEAKLVFGTAVEIDPETIPVCRPPGKYEGIVLVPI